MESLNRFFLGGSFFDCGTKFGLDFVMVVSAGGAIGLGVLLVSVVVSEHVSGSGLEGARAPPSTKASCRASPSGLGGSWRTGDVLRGRRGS